MSALDKQAGLKSTMGNEQLYSRLLGKFAINYDNFSEKFNTALKNDIEEAVRLAHTLKGNAGSLGMPDVQQSALELEMACREGQADTSEPLADLQNKLDLALQEITGLL
jgi:two-component system sensor histidine kinase/response regulator